MTRAASPAGLLAQETRALLTRLDRVRPFALQEPMLPAAAIEGYLARGRRSLRARAYGYLRGLGQQGAAAPPARLHQGYVSLRLLFNVVLSQFDLFADAITQRSERDTGVFLAGLEVAATDGLAVAGDAVAAPPVLRFLDRGPGGAIRRARTRLPGGGANPVALIRVPRERMVGAGVASSLVHEVGHQGATLLDLEASLGPLLRALQRQRGAERIAWRLWERWISEILADLWAVARVSSASTLGLMGLVSVPAAFQFRIDAHDPHPAPLVRVLLSCALGDAFYPHPQWTRLARLWQSRSRGVSGSVRRESVSTATRSPPTTPSAGSSRHAEENPARGSGVESYSICSYGSGSRGWAGKTPETQETPNEGPGGLLRRGRSA